MDTVFYEEHGLKLERVHEREQRRMLDFNSGCAPIAALRRMFLHMGIQEKLLEHQMQLRDGNG